MIEFKRFNYSKNPRYYDEDRVKLNFYKGQKILEYPDQDRSDLLYITVNSVGHSDPIQVASIIKSLHNQISRHFWGRKSRYKKLPFLTSIEPDKNNWKYHFHGLLKLQDLKNYPSVDAAIEVIRDSILSLREVKKDSKQYSDPVHIVHLSTDESLDHYQRVLTYIMKESTHQYDPLFHLQEC